MKQGTPTGGASYIDRKNPFRVRAHQLLPYFVLRVRVYWVLTAGVPIILFRGLHRERRLVPAWVVGGKGGLMRRLMSQICVTHNPCGVQIPPGSLFRLCAQFSQRSVMFGNMDFGQGQMECHLERESQLCIYLPQGVKKKSVGFSQNNTQVKLNSYRRRKKRIDPSKSHQGSKPKKIKDSWSEHGALDHMDLF